MKGFITAAVVNLIAALMVSAQSPAPESSVKPEAALAKELDHYLDSLVAESTYGKGNQGAHSGEVRNSPPGS
ncbi:MAG: hypothetical protein DLM73_00845 [Chthoniobacterales bacterium]|nr:MAG: hypothetical protein DLM73_00845 [Chthoniobacterales bacterium]